MILFNYYEKSIFMITTSNHNELGWPKNFLSLHFFTKKKESKTRSHTWRSSSSGMMPPPFASKIARTGTISSSTAAAANANTTGTAIWRKCSISDGIVRFTDHVVMVVVVVARVLVVGLVIVVVVVIVGIVKMMVLVIGIEASIVKMLVVVVVVLGMVVMMEVVGLLVAIETFSSVPLQLRRLWILRETLTL